ncbi:MAG: PilZ domain-containing protein [Candidatus Xenobia bacterium]
MKPLLMEAGFDAASIVERRQYMRVRSLLKGHLREDEAPVGGIVINLGAGGALFEGERHVEPGTPVMLELGPHGARARLTCRGTVQRSAPRGSRHLAAIIFKPLDDAQTALLHTYLRALRRDED